MRTLRRLIVTLACAVSVSPAWGIAPLATAARGTLPTEPVASVVSPHDRLMEFLFRSVMDPRQLAGYRIALLATDGVDGFDLEVPRRYLLDRGATVHVVVPRPRSVVRATGSGTSVRPVTHITILDPSGMEGEATIDRFLDQVEVDSYDVVYVPGLRGTADVRTDREGIAFLRQAVAARKAIFSSGNALRLAAEGELLPVGDAGPMSGSPARGVGRFPANAAASLYLGRDAFELPWLVDRLVETLLTRPVVADR
jgi:putative intracellular protease/amidase